MNYRKYLILLLLGLFWGMSQAQTAQYTIEGRVTYELPRGRTYRPGR